MLACWWVELLQVWWVFCGLSARVSVWLISHFPSSANLRRGSNKNLHIASLKNLVVWSTIVNIFDVFLLRLSRFQVPNFQHSSFHIFSAIPKFFRWNSSRFSHRFRMISVAGEIGGDVLCPLARCRWRYRNVHLWQAEWLGRCVMWV